MSETTTQPADGGQPSTTAPAGTVPATSTTPPTGQPTGQPGTGATGGTGSTEAESFDALPAWAQQQMRALRAENASARTKAKTDAATEERNRVLAEIGKALGFTSDSTPDPEKLTKDLSDLSAKHRGALVELAVLKVAPKAKGNASALLDSRSFLDVVGKLDPTADGFADQVEAAIAQAVRNNPLLGVGTPAGASGGAIPGGTADAGGGESEEDIVKRVRATRGIR